MLYEEHNPGPCYALAKTSSSLEMFLVAYWCEVSLELTGKGHANQLPFQGTPKFCLGSGSKGKLEHGICQINSQIIIDSQQYIKHQASFWLSN